MGVIVTVPATVTQLTTLARVQAELGVASGTDDTILGDMIDRASSAICRETRRVFGVETVVETMDGTGSRLLGLTRTPVLAVTLVTEDSVAITDYSVEDADAGALYRLNGWGRSSGLRMWGTEAYASGYILPGYQDQRYSVTYQAGYRLPTQSTPTLPGAVEQACLETVKAWYRIKQTDVAQPPGVKRLTAGSTTIEWDLGARAQTAEGLPLSALGLLRNYYAGALR